MRNIQESDSLSYNKISDKRAKIFGTSSQWGVMVDWGLQSGLAEKEAFEEGRQGLATH